MRCHRIQKRLVAYQDREIGGKEREQITVHLEGCQACRTTYAELEQAWQSLEKIPEIQVSPGFERRLSARINAVPKSHSRWRFPWISWVDQWRPAPVMAVILLLTGMALGGYLGNVLVSGVRSLSVQTDNTRIAMDIHSFKAFAAAPPGSLGDGYLRMATFTEDSRK